MGELDSPRLLLKGEGGEEGGGRRGSPPPSRQYASFVVSFFAPLLRSAAAAQVSQSTTLVRSWVGGRALHTMQEGEEDKGSLCGERGAFLRGKTWVYTYERGGEARMHGGRGGGSSDCCGRDPPLLGCASMYRKVTAAKRGEGGCVACCVIIV